MQKFYAVCTAVKHCQEFIDPKELKCLQEILRVAAPCSHQLTSDDEKKLFSRSVHFNLTYYAVQAELINRDCTFEVLNVLNRFLSPKLTEKSPQENERELEYELSQAAIVVAKVMLMGDDSN